MTWKLIRTNDNEIVLRAISGNLAESLITVRTQDEHNKNRYCSIKLRHDYSSEDVIALEEKISALSTKVKHYQRSPGLTGYDFTFLFSNADQKAKDFFSCIQGIHKINAFEEEHLAEIERLVITESKPQQEPGKSFTK